MISSIAIVVSVIIVVFRHVESGARCYLYLYLSLSLYIYIYNTYTDTYVQITYMRNLLGWLEARLAQIALDYLKLTQFAYVACSM